MAGKPKMRKLEADIEERGGEQWFFDQIADGIKWADIAAELGVSRPMLYKWLQRKDGRQEALREARRLTAMSFADDGLQILDTADPRTANLAKARAAYRQWLAERFDRESFAQKASTEVNVQIDARQLHLTAIQRPEEKPEDITKLLSESEQE